MVFHVGSIVIVSIHVLAWKKCWFKEHSVMRYLDAAVPQYLSALHNCVCAIACTSRISSMQKLLVMLSLFNWYNYKAKTQMHSQLWGQLDEKFTKKPLPEPNHLSRMHGFTNLNPQKSVLRRVPSRIITCQQHSACSYSRRWTFWSTLTGLRKRKWDRWAKSNILIRNALCLWIHCVASSSRGTC